MNMKREAASMLRYISRLFVRKIFSRFFAVLVASSLILNLTMDSYAAVPVAVTNGLDLGMDGGDLSGSGFIPDSDWITATVSNADDFASPDLQLAREMQTRYEKSFEYCPITLENRLNQRIAFVDDLLVILALLLSACGIYLASNDAIKDLFTSFEPWFRMSYGDDAAAMGVWETILVGNLGMSIVGMAIFLPILQEFLGLELTGYGTGATDFEISGAGAVPITTDGTYVPGYPLHTITSPIFGYYCDSWVSGCTSYNYIFEFVSASKFSLGRVDAYLFDGFYRYAIASTTGDVSIRNTYLSYPFTVNCGSVFPWNSLFLDNIIKSPDFVLGDAGIIIIPSTNAWTDLQQDAAVRYGDALAVPKTLEEWQALQAQLAGATTTKEAVDALAPAIALEVIEGTTPDDKPEEDIYPWLPGITSPLTGIMDIIKTLPEALINIKNEIVAIPGQITDFLTIDTVVIAGAFAGLQETFVNRFSGIGQLAGVFNRNYTFSTVYPVIKMAIPADPPILRQMFDGKSEIVFLDLNPFADNFKYVRNLLIATLYVAFAFWFLDEFDVKMHIG